MTGVVCVCVCLGVKFEQKSNQKRLLMNENMSLQVMHVVTRYFLVCNAISRIHMFFSMSVPIVSAHIFLCLTKTTTTPTTTQKSPSKNMIKYDRDRLMITIESTAPGTETC